MNATQETLFNKAATVEKLIISLEEDGYRFGVQRFYGRCRLACNLSLFGDDERLQKLRALEDEAVDYIVDRAKRYIRLCRQQIIRSNTHVTR